MNGRERENCIKFRELDIAQRRVSHSTYPLGQNNVPHESSETAPIPRDAIYLST